MLIIYEKKSNKLAKLERNRFSWFTDDLNKCYFCPNTSVDKHEIFGGCRRQTSMKYGMVLPLCRMHHSLFQNDKYFNDTCTRKDKKNLKKDTLI